MADLSSPAARGRGTAHRAVEGMGGYDRFVVIPRRRAAASPESKLLKTHDYGFRTASLCLASGMTLKPFLTISILHVDEIKPVGRGDWAAGRAVARL